jgi:hypothetical protein
LIGSTAWLASEDNPPATLNARLVRREEFKKQRRDISFLMAGMD